MDLDEQVVFLAARLCWPKKEDAELLMDLATVGQTTKHELMWRLQYRINVQEAELELLREIGDE